MSAHRFGGSTYRPACMQRLGLLPPYSIEDVKRAYRQLAKTTHPDGGGDAEEFALLHEAYERALNLAVFHESRRAWLGERVDRYLERERFAADVEACGGRCLLQRPEVYLPDFGPDFAHLLCELVAVYLTQNPQADAALDRLHSHPAFQEIRLLDLSHSGVTDDGLSALADSGLCGLDLRGTRISARGVEIVSRLPKLEWLHLGQTRVGLWSRLRLRQTYPDLEIVTDRDADHPDFDSPQYRQSQLIQRVAGGTDGPPS